MGARWRGSGHGYYFLLRKSFLIETEKLLTKFGYLLPGRAAVENRHAGTGEGISSDGEIPPPLRCAAFGIFSRLEVTHVNFLFLLFAHITFLSCVFGFGLC